MQHNNLCLFVLLAFGLTTNTLLAADETEFQELRTPSGVRFAILGGMPSKPAPTLFIFAHSLETMRAQPIYVDVLGRLKDHGFLGVTLDAACHGEDARPGEPSELPGWRFRIEKDEAFIDAFTTRAKAVIDYLVEKQYIDPTRIGAYGTSRGGFLAFHFAAAEPRVRAVAGIAPVTNLLALREFDGTSHREAAERLGLIQLAPKLAGRPAWLGIGNHDERVSTDDAIAFTRALVREASARSQSPDASFPIELVVGSSVGHTRLDHTDELLADWFAKQLAEKSAH